MRFFSLTKEIAIDLGTANTVIIHNDKIVIDEPSIVALDRNDKLIAVGKEAQLMQGREPEGIRTVRPLRKGVIADFNAAELMIRGLIKKASSKSNWFSPSLRMVVGIFRFNRSGDPRRTRLKRARRRPRRLHAFRAYGRSPRYRPGR